MTVLIGSWPSAVVGIGALGLAWWLYVLEHRDVRQMRKELNKALDWMNYQIGPPQVIDPITEPIEVVNERTAEMRRLDLAGGARVSLSKGKTLREMTDTKEPSKLGRYLAGGEHRA